MSLGPTKGGVGVEDLGDARAGVPLLLGGGVETVLTGMLATGWPGWSTLRNVRD